MSSKKAPEGPQPLDLKRLPQHVAMIMDGNGRWARKRLRNRVKGHEKGVETVRTIVEACRDIGIPYLTLYAFSTENWQRPKAEVTALMTLLKRFIINETPDMAAKGIRLNIIGQIHRLPNGVQDVLADALAATAGNSRLVLTLALSYGSRTEIVDMVRSVVDDAMAGRQDPAAIDDDTVRRHLYTADLPDPDIVIRTSGEMRLSNFLLWQIAYAELVVTDTLWPDFSPEELYALLATYQQRDRRFGKI